MDPKKAVWMAAAFLCVTVHAAGSDEWRVEGVSGTVHITKGSSSRTVSAAKGVLIGPGEAIRTGPKGAVDLDLGPRFHGKMRLGEKSLMKILAGPAPRIRLERGRLLMLREGEGVSESLVIASPEAQIRIEWAGCGVTVGERGTQVQVYSEAVQIAAERGRSEEVREGFRVMCSAGMLSEPERMNYADYADWQPWVRWFYEQSDRAALESIERIVER